MLRRNLELLDEIAVKLHTESKDSFRQAEINNIRTVLLGLLAKQNDEEVYKEQLERLIDLQRNDNSAGLHDQFKW